MKRWARLPKRQPNFGCRDRSRSRTNLPLRRGLFLQHARITVKRSRLVELGFHHPRLKSWSVVMVVGYEFQPQPCLTIQHTNGERLEGLRCCELPE